MDVTTRGDNHGGAGGFVSRKHCGVAFMYEPVLTRHNIHVVRNYVTP